MLQPLDEDELVAAHAHEQIALARQRRQPVRDLLQQGIADRVAEPVIGGLEMIEIDRVTTAPPSVGQNPAGPRQRRAVADAGHGIETGEMFELLFQDQLIDGELKVRRTISRLPTM